MHPFPQIRRIFERECLAVRVAMLLSVVAAVIYGGGKGDGGDPQLRGSPAGGDPQELRTFTDAEQALGFACITNPVAITGLCRSAGITPRDALAAFETTSNATAKASWLATGVFDDYFTVTHPTNAPVRIGTNDVRRLMVFSHGSAKAVLENGDAAYLEPFHAPMSFVAESKWAECGVTSRCWTASSSASTIVAWEGALLNRDSAQPLSFQVEFLQNGNFIYRYGDTDAIDSLTNATFSIGPLRPSSPPCENSSITGAISRASSLYFADISAYGDGTGDTDEDDLTDYEELMIHGTDPLVADTDGDGLGDGVEIVSGTDPLDFDTDGDGIPDGWTSSSYAANPFLASGESDADIVIRFADGEENACGVFLFGNVPFILSGTNQANIAISVGTLCDFAFTSGDGKAHSLCCEIICGSGSLRSGDRGSRSAAGGDLYAEDPSHVLGGAPTKRGGGRLGKVGIELHTDIEPSQCVHLGHCSVTVEMEPDIWDAIKDFATIDGGELRQGGGILMDDIDTPGQEYTLAVSIGDGIQGYRATASVTVHCCSGGSSYICPICGMRHHADSDCPHGALCGFAGGGLCTCDPKLVPLNADDDDWNGTEDRHQSALADGEDDLAGFPAGFIGGSDCCCLHVTRKVRFTSIPQGVRLWLGDERVQTGTKYEEPLFSVEGDGSTATGQVSRVSWQILEGEGEDEHVVLAANRTVAVSPVATVSFSPSDTYGGEAVVVKRSTDPVRTNNATCHVSASGLADGRYRLHTNKGLFQDTDASSCDMEIFLGSGSAELYGYTPSATTNDATVFFRTVEDNTFASTNYTVLWVDISMRCGQDDPFSPDNGLLASSSQDILGKQMHAGFYLPSISRSTPSVACNVVELIGTIHPSDFAENVTLVRDCIDESVIIYFTNGTHSVVKYNINKERGVEPSGNDLTPDDFRDSDPSPNGRVFDIDTPGFSVQSPENLPQGTFIAAKYNFLQYAGFDGKRCSNDFPWFSRTTARRNYAEDPAEIEFFTRQNHPYDNYCSQGQMGVSQ